MFQKKNEEKGSVKMENVKVVIFFICLISITFLVITYVVNLTGLAYISQINLEIFCVFLSLLISAFIWCFLHEKFDKKIIISIDENLLVFVIIFLLVAALFMFAANYGSYRSYEAIVYLPWVQIPVFVLISTIVLYGVVLYVPAYLVHRVIFHNCKIDPLAKIALYPTVTMLIFGFIGFLPLKNLVYLNFLVPFLIIVCLFLMLLDNFARRGRSGDKMAVINIDVNELLMLTGIILFRLFLQFSAAGEVNAFVKGDAVSQAGNVAFIDRYGVAGYLMSSLTERYPLFFFAAWSTLTRILPLPYCNVLVLTELFHQVFATLTFYMFARALFGKASKGLFATLVLTLTSGFSYLYVLTDPPPSFISAGNVYDYYWKIFNKYGTSSGAPMSTIYTDDHALNRLWSLGLFFGFIATLLNANKGSQSRKLYLIVALACFMQIALGHPTEIILANIAIATFIILTKLQGLKEIFATLGSSTLISEAIASTFGYSTLSLILIGSPLLTFTFLVVVKRISDEKGVKWRLSPQKKIALFNTISLLLIFYYGLSWIAFASNYHRVWISVPLVNLWYVFPIEWGFSGFLFLLAVIKALSAKWINLPYYLKYAFLTFLMLFAFIVSIDCINLFFYYSYVTNPLIPVYFIPFFALASVFLVENPISAKIKKFKRAFLLPFLVTILVLASFNHIISTSYWKSCGWRSETHPLKNLTYEDIQLANTLYNALYSSSLEMAAYLPASDPIPEVDEITYQKTVRYPIYDVDYITLLSGFKIPQKIVNDVLYEAHSIDELIYLKQFYPLNYLIIEKNSTNFLSQFLKENETPIFKGQQYLVYNITNLRPSKSYDLRTEGLIVVDKVAFRGNLTLLSENSSKILLNNITGEMFPLENGLVGFKYYNDVNLTEVYVYDGQENFWRGDGWGQGTVGFPILNENEDMQIAGLRSTEINVPPGNFSVSAAIHIFSEPYPNWSEYDFISVYLYGINDLGKITLAVYGGGDKGSNAYLWYIVDNFSGWKHFIIPLHAPNYKGSDFDVTSIRQIHIRWSTPGIRYIDRISVFVTKRETFLAPNIYINGQVSLINVRTSPNYFPEARNLAQKIDILGLVSFNVLHTFDDKRAYLGSLEYQGAYKICPEPWDTNPYTAKQMIQAYIKDENISPLEVLKGMCGLTWTILCLIFTILTIGNVKLKIVLMHSRYLFCLICKIKYA